MTLNPKARKWLLVAVAFLVVFLSYLFVFFQKN